MPTMEFNRFDLGIDHRKGASVSDANRLLEMKNAHVTTGLATEKRPGFTKFIDLEPGTKGLFPAFGKLNTFYGEGEITHANDLFDAHKLQLDGEDAPVIDIPWVDTFNAAIYVAATFEGGITKHHYLSGDVHQIADENCPHTTACKKMASKIFAVSPDGATVRFSKTGDPTVWTGADDAGFLPTGLNASGDRSTNALGEYQNKLVCLSRDAAQIWAVDPDPKLMILSDVVKNVGTSYPESLATVAGDLYFLSDFGFRSITTQQLTEKMSDVDIGSPIDNLVQQSIEVLTTQPLGVYFDGIGKYLCTVNDQVYVYSVSRTARIAAWSRYEIPFAVDAFAELGGVLYCRSGDSVYTLDKKKYTDDGEIYEVVLQLPYMDFKSPGQLKRIYGLDVVIDGECMFSIGFDASHTDFFTDEVRVKGNTRGGGMIPIEVCGTEFSFKFRNMTNQAFRLDAVNVYFEVLGTV